MSKKWIFLRGLTRGVGHWGDFIELFKARFPNDEVELIDIPGNGFRNHEKSPSELSEYVALMRSRSEFLTEGPVNVVALSLGAMIAAEWARQFPKDFRNLILINTSSASLQSFYKRFLPPNYLNILKLLAEPSIRLRENLVGKMVMNHEERRMRFLDAMTQHSEEHPIQPINLVNQLRAASGFTFPQDPPLSVQNIQVWCSSRDHLVSNECSIQIARRWGVLPQVHPWAGHDLPLDDPEWALIRLEKL